jgi:hypothetical protein
MNDITFTASRLAAHRGAELALAAERRRRIAESTAANPVLPTREPVHVNFPRLRFPHIRFPHVRGDHTVRPAH